MRILKFLRKRKRKRDEEHASHRKDSLKKEEPLPSSTQITRQVLRVSDTLQLTVVNVPTSITDEQRNRILLSLLRNTLASLPDRSYKRGERLYEGTARLRVGDEVHEVLYSLDAIRAITALRVYKQAFDVVKLGAETGRFDEELAELTAEYFKQSAWKELLLAQKGWKMRSVKPNFLELSPPEEGETANG